MVQITDSEHLTSLHAAGGPVEPGDGEKGYKRLMEKLMVKFVKILDDVQMDDQLQLKLMLVANCRKHCPRLVVPMTAVFIAAEHRQPLLIEMKK